jgi:hypothetical protein
VFVALRIALSTVTTLGARPDAQLRTTAPDAVLQAVTYGGPSPTPARCRGAESARAIGRSANDTS